MSGWFCGCAGTTRTLRGTGKVLGCVPRTTYLYVPSAMARSPTRSEESVGQKSVVTAHAVMPDGRAAGGRRNVSRRSEGDEEGSRTRIAVKNTGASRNMARSPGVMDSVARTQAYFGFSSTYCHSRERTSFLKNA